MKIRNKRKQFISNALLEGSNKLQEILVIRKKIDKHLENFHVKVRLYEELGNLLNQISQFDFEIKYKPGITNVETVCLSRNAVLNENNDTYTDIIPTLNTVIL